MTRTRTLSRVPGVDFRLPTDEELDAMLNFEGRPLGEIDLAALFATEGLLR